MSETELLYYEDNYMRSCQAEVVEVRPSGLILDRTVFYPQGGGQLGDTGKIGGMEIVDTIRTDGVVLHRAGEPVVASVGDSVEEELDWDRRYALMRHHTLLHLVHIAFVDRYGDARIRGSEVRPDKARVDYEYFESVEAEVVEPFVADLVEHDLPVTTEPVEGSERERIWSIPGFDPIPCGGTHVRSTGELGSFAIKAKRKGKQGVRIYAETVNPPSGE
jgi:Ser-tRNA(Ala) deacylase AlaX